MKNETENFPTLKNNFILGDPGTGKTQLITRMLNQFDLAATAVFTIGRIDNSNLNYENLNKARSWMNLGIFPPSQQNQDINTDKENYDLFKKELAEKELTEKEKLSETLVIVDESGYLTNALIEEIIGDLKDGKITLWIAAQSFNSFAQDWNLKILNEFGNFYFFKSRFNEKFLNAETIKSVSDLPRGIENYLHFASAPQTRVKQFFSDELQNFLNRDDIK